MVVLPRRQMYYGPMNTTTATAAPVRRRSTNGFPNAVIIEDIPAEQLAPAQGVLEAVVPVHLDAADKLSVKLYNYRGNLDSYGHDFTVGSVAEYTARNGGDVEAAIERAIDLGHNLYFAFNEGSMISAHPQERVARRELALGTIIEMDGHRFQILQAANNNLQLVPLPTV